MSDSTPNENPAVRQMLTYMGTDAVRWTWQFLDSTNLSNAGPDFKANVTGWFANAIEAGREAGYSKVFHELKAMAINKGFDTSEIFSLEQLFEQIYREVPGDHLCL